ncbi:MAG: tryptophan 7-halogenase [Caldilineaceae bacterium]|nr:tryptophan 7-halogenase [Caldilineaceae bacterium]
MPHKEIAVNDVIIIGGGPAGSVLGCYLSMAGISNLIIEGSIFPRAHVGESLVTSTTRVFKEIGFLPTMEREGFVRKYGASWHAPTSREFGIDFDPFPEEGIDQNYTYHVDRSKFDLLLLKHAESLGSKIYQGVRVQKVLFENDQACGVRVKMGDQEVDLPCKMVVDASGRQTILGNQLKLKLKDPIFNQYAVHAWYKDLDRGSGITADWIHIYFLPIERGWVWQIPITDEITSVGVVAEREIFKQAKLDLESYFNKYTQTNPDLVQAMSSATRVNEFKTEGDYSYCMERFVGNGYLLVGDAARFVDPIFSSGVSVACFGARMASEVIRNGFELDDFSEATLMPYEKRLRSGVEIWYEFIRLYYKLLPLFTHFIQSKDHRQQIKRLLQGLVFDREEAPVLQAMRDYVKAVESSDHHLFKAHLAAVPID